MKLIYVKDFTPKQELTVNLVKNTVYLADHFEDVLQVKAGDAYFYLSEGITDNGNFSCDILVLTEENHKSLKLSKEDKKLVKEFFMKDVVSKEVKKAQSKVDKELDEAFEEFGKLTENDPFLLLSMAKVAKAINGTYNDKYSDDTVDLYGLMRTSKHGRGFNIGNSLKYLRRYMTDGFSKSYNPEDLLKAAHFLLLELDRRTNEI